LVALIHHKDVDILTDTASALSHLLKGGDESIQLVVDSGVIFILAFGI
jgi:hypothetical protein